jgi:hypothetical protein
MISLICGQIALQRHGYLILGFQHEPAGSELRCNRKWEYYRKREAVSSTGQRQRFSKNFIDIFSALTLLLSESPQLSLKIPTTMASTCRILRSSSGVVLHHLTSDVRPAACPSIAPSRANCCSPRRAAKTQRPLLTSLGWSFMGNPPMSKYRPLVRVSTSRMCLLRGSYH